LIDGMSHYVPATVIDIARDQMERLLHADNEKLVLHGGVSVLVALWSAQQGGRSFLRALTIVNERGRRRSFWGRYVAGGAITFGAMFAALFTIFTFTFASALFARVGADAGLALQVLRPLVLIGLMTGFALALYRWGPARRPPAWRWVWPGALFASVVWLIVTAGFSFYADMFTPWRAIYGVFSGVFVLMLWLFLSTYIFLFGAELNAQLERICAAEVKAGEVSAGECGASAAPAEPAEPAPVSGA
jgi:membrane protein